MAGEAKNSRQFDECYTISLTAPRVLINRKKFYSVYSEDSCNGNGNAVDCFSPSSSESSLVSQMQTSVHDNDLSSNSRSKAKRGRKDIINEIR